MSAVAFFDLGATCGYAVGRPGNITSNDWALPARGESRGDRLLSFWARLEKLHEAFDIKAVGYEGVRAHKGVDAAHWYGAYEAVVHMFCAGHGIPIEAVPVGTIKKFWTGKGNARKEQMIEAARQRNFEPASDNEADALAGLHWMLAQPTEVKEAAE